MIILVKYSPADKSTWDAIVAQANNSHFMFYRDYMEYHSDRFPDASYLMLENGKPIAIIAGTIQDDHWYSHAGLTFGGWLMKIKKNRIEYYLEGYRLLWQELLKLGCCYATIKSVPCSYHRNPCEGDLYVLGQENIEAHHMEVTTSINLYHDKHYISKSQSYCKKKAEENGYIIEKSNEYELFWQVVQKNLEQKYGTKPVHTIDEIKHLQKLFPDNIMLFLVKKPDGSCVAGNVLYITDTVYHSQYMSANDEGMQSRALDLLCFDMIERAKIAGKRFFDFGISTEQNGIILNQGLVHFKESFGGGAVMHHTIKIKL